MGVVVAGIGAASVASLHASLVARLDQQLVAFAIGTQQALATPGRPAPDASQLLAAPGQPLGAIGAIVVDGRVTVAGRLDPEGPEEDITADQATELAAVTSGLEPTTVDLGDLGDYRAVAVDLSGGKLVLGISLSAVQRTTSQLAGTVLGLAAAGLALAAGLGAVIVRFALRPLDRVAAVATEVADLPLDRGEIALSVRVPERYTDPRTEVGRVGSAFNRMLGHVDSALLARQASEQRLRRFVADASHELRTPLASIRGYAELTRRMGDQLPEDAAYALGRIESESVRMTALVEDLLLLARIDAKQELVRSADVDLVALVHDAVRDAEAAGADHMWAVRLPSVPLTASVDRARIQQVIANLLGNARVHTPAGTTVTVTLESIDDGAAARLAVADDGPGIDEKLTPNLFERFVRGDSSRSRHAGSTGLGLAIVDAVVRAHGGTVVVESAPGHTVFTVELPVAAPAEHPADETALAHTAGTG